MGPTVRAKAVQWLATNFEVRSGFVSTSKFHLPQHSWTRESSWWLEFPRSVIDVPCSPEIHLICEKEPGADDFYYLKVPVEFFQMNLSSFYIRKNGPSLWLSAEAKDMFVDKRGGGQVSLREFLVQKH